jgi:hypothetical protein
MEPSETEATEACDWTPTERTELIEAAAAVAWAPAAARETDAMEAWDARAEL